MAAITEAQFLGSADLTAHASFASAYTDEGTAVVEADYDTDWGAGNANDWATALTAVHKWMRGTSPITGSVIFGGDVEVNSSSPTVSIDKSPTGSGVLWFRVASTPTTNDKRALHDTDETWKLQDHTGAVWQTAITVDNSAQVDLPKSATMGANLTLDSASPIATFGDDTGGPINRIRKADASNASFADVFSGGSRYWDCLVDTTENWRISRYIAGTLQESDTLVIKNTDGEVQVANNLNLTNDAPRLTMGNGASDPRLIRDKDGATDGFDEWKSDSLRRWLGWYFNSNENLEVRRYNASEVFQETSFSIDQATGEATFAKEIQASLGIDASSGSVIGGSVSGGRVSASDDLGGVASTVSFTNSADSPQDTAATLGNWRVASAGGTFAGWVKIYVGTTAGWMPYWTA